MNRFNSQVVAFGHNALKVRLAACALSLVCVPGAMAQRDDSRTATGEAPPNHVVLRETRGGAYFVARALKEKYDKLVSRVRALSSDLDSQRVTGAQATAELFTLQRELDVLRTEMEVEKVRVSPLKIHTQKEEVTFDLGPEKMLVVTAGRVRVEGWDKPQVKCVLEKTVLSADDKPVDRQMAAIRLVHVHGAAPQLVKEPRTQARAGGDESRLMTQEWSQASAFTKGEVDTVAIDGLMDNEQLFAEIKTPEGKGSYGGTQWQRDAELTVYVPQCNSVALRGCSGSLEVQNVHASLILTAGGAWSVNRHEEDSARVKDLYGSLTSVGVALDQIEGIHGNVNITGRLSQTTQSFGPDGRAINTSFRSLNCRDIQGDLTAWFVRTDVYLSGVTGQIDVRNDYGNTVLNNGKPLAAKAHRIISQSGRIEAELTGDALGAQPVLALTNSGKVQTNADQDVLAQTTFAIDDDYDSRRDWRGVASDQKGGKSRPANAEVFDRLNAALEGNGASPGLSLISRDGTISVKFAGK